MVARFRVWNLDGVELPVRFARREVGTALDGWELGHLKEGAELLVSELVTNAIRHGKAPVRMALAVLDGGLEISVRDGNPDSLQPREGDEEGGFGLTVITAIADLTVHPYPGGKKVSALLPLF